MGEKIIEEHKDNAGAVRDSPRGGARRTSISTG
jgi:hypothetical protein